MSSQETTAADNSREAPPRRGGLRNVLVAGGFTLAAAFVLAGVTRTDADGPDPEAASAISLDDQALTVMADSLVTVIPSVGDTEVRTVPLGADGISPVPREADATVGSAYVVTEPVDGREWRLWVATAGAAGDSGVPECPVLRGPVPDMCDVVDTADGVEKTETYVSIATPELGPDKYGEFQLEAVTPEVLPDLRVEYLVTLYRPDGSQISSRETVYGPSSTDLEASILEAESLTALVHDSELIAQLTAG